MLSEALHENAALYASGAMSPQERERFELILEFREDLRRLVAELGEVSASLSLATAAPNSRSASPELRKRVAALIDGKQQAAHHGFVVCGPDRLVQWVNPAFSAMCGYSLDELRGKRLGPLLQGGSTDPGAVARMRSAVEESRPCRETLLNYRKDGTTYWVDVDITPITDDAGELLWLVARERELAQAPAA